ncbi:hypothetical protein GCM10011583_61920 [Streptomyces camponoticapitis]|uniref:DUF4190 domain-containing protein n=1 Tax=Streptomyces camponoticapitis TaxID=1616125 RepID=A0ABQ2EUQ2_9ACTN|nr:DUF4190 domain-containing protein [Streptomyces camponoticapitis]GGK21542.1 hypothetical protein GCM10011583_61920 [Streptomyces camponoticapitis]
MSLPNYPHQAADGTSPHTTPEPAPARSNALAVAALVLGIIAVLLFWTVVGGIFLGLLAVVLGIIGARRARGGRAPRRTMAIVGAVLGAVGLVASTVIVIIGVSLFNSEEFDNFNDCMEHANSQSEKDQCAEDFSKDVEN